MGRANFRWMALGASAVVAAVLLWLQRDAGRQMRDELSLLRESHRELDALRAANRRLAEEQVSNDELERLRVAHAAAVHLRTELEKLQRLAKEPPVAEATAAPRRASLVSQRESPEMIPASAWKNAGRATPAAAVETALWAAVGGDVDQLAATITLSAEARQRAERVLAGLPEAARAQYPTPEKFAALFTARDVPVATSLGHFSAEQRNADEAVLRVVLESGEPTAERGTRRAARVTHLTVRRFDDGWKLEVPASAIEKYAGTLKTPLQ